MLNPGPIMSFNRGLYTNNPAKLGMALTLVGMPLLECKAYTERLVPSTPTQKLS